MAPERGADLHATLSLTFDQAMAGGEFRVPLVRQDSCRECAGTGVRLDARRRGVRRATAAAASARRAGTWCFPGLRALPGIGPAGRSSGARAAVVWAAWRGANGSRLRVPGREFSDQARLRVAGARQRRAVGRAAGRSVRHGARGAAPAVPARGRRSAPRGARRRARSRAWRAGRDSARRRRRAAARAARDAVRAAVPVARPRRAVAAGRQPRRPGRRDSAGVAAVLDERSKALLQEFGALNGENVRQQFDEAWKATSRNGSGA